MKICDIITYENVIFSLELLGEKFLKIPWKSEGKLGELSFSEMCPPCSIISSILQLAGSNLV